LIDIKVKDYEPKIYDIDKLITYKNKRGKQ